MWTFFDKQVRVVNGTYNILYDGLVRGNLIHINGRWYKMVIQEQKAVLEEVASGLILRIDIPVNEPNYLQQTL